jgi:anaerobic selenocysteine-containing dehydrogenase
MDARAHRRTCGISVAEVVDLAREYGTMASGGEPVAIRTNYGVQRVRGGGMAVRNMPACRRWSAPGAIRPAASSCRPRFVPDQQAGLQRPDLLKRLPRTINMTTIGDDLLRPSSPEFGPEVEAVIVYNANPLAIAPDSAKVMRGFRARGFVHRGAGALPDRHRRLCRHRAAGHHAAGAHRRPHWPTATCT